MLSNGIRISRNHPWGAANRTRWKCYARFILTYRISHRARNNIKLPACVAGTWLERGQGEV